MTFISLFRAAQTNFQFSPVIKRQDKELIVTSEHVLTWKFISALKLGILQVN